MQDLHLNVVIELCHLRRKGDADVAGRKDQRRLSRLTAAADQELHLGLARRLKSPPPPTLLATFVRAGRSMLPRDTTGVWSAGNSTSRVVVGHAGKRRSNDTPLTPGTPRADHSKFNVCKPGRSTQSPNS